MKIKTDHLEQNWRWNLNPFNYERLGLTGQISGAHMWCLCCAWKWKKCTLLSIHYADPGALMLQKEVIKTFSIINAHEFVSSNVIFKITKYVTVIARGNSTRWAKLNLYVSKFGLICWVRMGLDKNTNCFASVGTDIGSIHCYFRPIKMPTKRNFKRQIKKMLLTVEGIHLGSGTDQQELLEHLRDHW